MKNICIITPCFNESNIIDKFLSELGIVLSELTNYNFSIIVVDDGSTDNSIAKIKEIKYNYSHIKLTLLQLRFNLGHQRAIYQGLLYASELEADRYIILDSDGEDDPSAIKELINITEYDIVHVVRGKRSENLKFKIYYSIYKLLFKLITGKQMNFGNYCMINRRVIDSVVSNSFIHFAAFLSKQKVNSTYIVVNRRKRIDGNSKMNLNSLLFHGFNSFVEFAEELLLIFLKLALGIALILIAVILYTLYLKFIGNATPGWASNLSAALFGISLTCFGFFTIGLLLINIRSSGKNESDKIFTRIL